jgi:hypothetical protein
MKKFLHYHIEGETTVGSKQVLLDQDTDLTAGFHWAANGYTVQPLLSQEEHVQLRQGMQRILFDLLHAQGISVDDQASLENYHRLIDNRDDLHYALAKWGLPLTQLPISAALLTRRISDLMRMPLRVRQIPSSDELLFGFRIIRPGSTDESPFHRDAWQDFWRNTLNVWIPVAGCNAQSTLAVLPGSHLWSESEVERTSCGALINGKQYKVPGVVDIFRSYDIRYPNPDYTDALLFSPYLIHGGAVNGNPDQTRVSIEIRFERAI